MSQRTLLERLDDWVNPIVVKELRQAVRSKLVVAALFVFLALQVGVLGIFLLSRAGRHGGLENDLQAGREAFQFIQGILLGTCLLIPGYAGFRLGYEHSDTNVDLLFISTLRPRSIVAGKLFSALVLVLLVYSACAPFMTFTYLLRGLDIPTILMLLLIDFLVTLVGIQLCLFVAVLPLPKPVKGALGLGVFLGFIFLYVGLLNMSYFMLTFGIDVPASSPEFWSLVGGLVVFGLSTTGLFFVWTVALLSPASANRSLIVRLFLGVFWLVTGAAAYWMSDIISHFGPLTAWVAVNGALLCLHVLIAINERESWGSRIAKTIPRRWWLRAPAFLLYSGSAGGVLFGGLFLVLTLVVSCVVMELNPHWDEARDHLEVNRFMLELGLYTWCYCLSAVCLRHYLLRGQFRAQFTWVAALLLLGLGSVLPYMIAYFFYPEALKYGDLERDWVVTSPFEQLGRGGVARGRMVLGPGGRAYYWDDMFDAMPQAVLGVWAFGVTALALPWMAQQVRRFRPPRRDDPALGKVPAELTQAAAILLPDGLPPPADNGQAAPPSEHVTAGPAASTPNAFTTPPGEEK